MVDSQSYTSRIPPHKSKKKGSRSSSGHAAPKLQVQHTRTENSEEHDVNEHLLDDDELEHQQFLRSQSIKFTNEQNRGLISEEDEFDDDFNEYDDSQEREFTFDLPIIPFISHTEKRHEALSKLLRLANNQEVTKTFITLASFIDPMTQPSETDTHVLSVSLISKLLISLRFDPKSIIPEFELSKQLFAIIEASLKFLNCSDEVKLRSFNNSNPRVDWRLELNEWTPHGINDQDLRLIYMINCVCIYTIFELYNFKEKDICMNPYLGFLLKLWKISTNVVLLGLEIDRRVEPLPNEITPNIVKQVIRGASAIRYVIASILNDDIDNRYHDFNHINILDFLSPYGRRNGSGALYADVRWYVGAMLALGSDLNEVIETLVDLYPNDRYDEDVRYMFDYEYDDHHHELLYPEDYDNGVLMSDIPRVYEDEEGNFHRIIIPRCDCEFFDDDRDAEEEVEGDDADSSQDFDGIPTAVRSDQNIEFDEMGRDWRDVPREANIFFNPEVRLQASNCYDFIELSKIMKQMSTEPVSEEVAQKVIITIARSVKVEFEQEINKTVTKASPDTKETEVDEKVVTPDKVYQLWSYDWVFEPILALNAEAAYSMLDEMFMAVGYRRVLIWFITHLALSFSLINYIFELITGLRGDSKERKKKFLFSRQGTLVLSEIEKSMLLHEFLKNCWIYLSKNFDRYSNVNKNLENASEFEKCLKMVKLICLMVNKLLEKEMIDIEEYKVELTSLLINWIGIVPEAKDIFFKINQHTDPEEIKNLGSILEYEKESPNDNSSGMEKLIQEHKHKTFNKELKVVLSNVIKKLDSGSLLFRPFFELMDSDSSTKENSESLERGIDKLFQYKGKPAVNYIKGNIIPIVRDEEFDQQNVEQALEI